MSGVIVADDHEVDVGRARRPRPPALSAQRKARRPRSARSRRRSCAPGSRCASRIHSSEVSTNSERSSFETNPLGDVGAEAGDRHRPAGRAASITPEPPRRSASRERPARRRPSPSPSPCRPGRGRPRPRTAGRACRRAHDALEPDVVDAREEDEPPLVLGLREHGDRAALSERLDHLHPGHDRVAGEVPGAVLVGDELPRGDALARDQLEHLVDEEERRAVRDDLLDLACRAVIELRQLRSRHAESRSRSDARPRWA